MIKSQKLRTYRAGTVHFLSITVWSALAYWAGLRTRQKFADSVKSFRARTSKPDKEISNVSHTTHRRKDERTTINTVASAGRADADGEFGPNWHAIPEAIAIANSTTVFSAHRTRCISTGHATGTVPLQQLIVSVYPTVIEEEEVVLLLRSLTMALPHRQRGVVFVVVVTAAAITGGPEY